MHCIGDIKGEQTDSKALNSRGLFQNTLNWNVKLWFSCLFAPFMLAWKSLPAVTLVAIKHPNPIKSSRYQRENGNYKTYQKRWAISDRMAFYHSRGSGPTVVVLFLGVVGGMGGKSHQTVPYLARNQTLRSGPYFPTTALTGISVGFGPVS